MGTRTALCLASLLLPAAAAAAEGELVLTWNECVKSAVAANPDVRESRFRLDAARSRRNAAFGGLLPRVGASLDMSDRGEGSHPDASELHPESYGASLRVSQSLFSGFSTLSDICGNMASVRRQRAALAAESADARNRLRRAFAELLHAQENITMLEKIAKRRADNAELVRLRYESGRENKGSAMRVAADAAQSAFEVSRARRAIGLVRRRLLRETGLDPAAAVEVRGDWDASPPPPSPDFDGIAHLVPAVVQAEAQVDEAAAAVAGAVSPFWPTADTSASISRAGPEWTPDEESWNAGLSFSWNLFSGGSHLGAAMAARANLAAAREALAAQRLDSRLAIEEAWTSLVDAVEGLEVRRRYLAAAQERAEIGRAQYANGMLSFTQWDLIEGELVDSERNELGARRDAIYAEAAWARALGRGLGE